MGSPLGSSMTGTQVLDREYFEVRAKLLELAPHTKVIVLIDNVDQEIAHLGAARRTG